MSFISGENLNRIASVGETTLTEADSFPKDLDYHAVGLDILNKGTVTLIFSLTTIKGETLGPFYIPTGESLSEDYPPFKRITVSQTTTEFYMIVRKTWEG